MTPTQQIQVALAWCLAWNQPHPSRDQATTLQQIRNACYKSQPCDPDLQSIVDAVGQLMALELPLELPQTVEQLRQYTQDHALLWEGRVGLVYGGATKIKPYVFDVPKLHEIRGASALLDNINLVDLPAFFHADSAPIEKENKTDSRPIGEANKTDKEENKTDRFRPCRKAGFDYCNKVRQWLTQENYGALIEALIPELIIYSTGGNILAFCPPDLVDMLSDAIEKRYTTETLTANSCAVGEIFRPLETKFGLLPETITDDMFWLEKCRQSSQDELVQAYVKVKPGFSMTDLETGFTDRKSFNELTSKLAILFNQRRAGNEVAGRSATRRYPVMMETQPYLQRDNTAKGIATLRAPQLPNQPWHSESSARKRVIGQIAKKRINSGRTERYSQEWYDPLKSRWEPNPKAESWVKRFEDYLIDCPDQKSSYYGKIRPDQVFEAQSVAEIGNASNKFIAYIYADGNNMGGYIQKIRDPEEYRQFSEDISKITQECVYKALAKHLTIHKLQGQTDPERYHENGDWIHSFEIIALGGDDVFLIVPASQALQIAKTIGEEFEWSLLAFSDKRYHVDENKVPPPQLNLIHRYQPGTASLDRSELSMSTGILITAEDTPIVYAEKLTGQLLKSAKEKAKTLKKWGYYGGTIDFLVLKSVTMISSNIDEFRKEGLVVKTCQKNHSHGADCPKDLHLYASPYTLHEIWGLLKLIGELKKVDFPRSQLYQIRSFLEKGKRTAILNYRYFRVRLKLKLQGPLLQHFEEDWCSAKENDGYIAPWMYYVDPPDPQRPEPKSHYETIWRELVDLYDFIPAVSDSTASVEPETAEVTT
jgi:CRISPR-associated protein Cmr2